MTQTDNAGNPRAVPGNNKPPGPIELAWSTYREVSAFMADTPVIQDENTARTAKLFWDRSKVSLDEMEFDRVRQVKPLNDTVTEINASFKEASIPLGKLRTELHARMRTFTLAEEARKAAELEALRLAVEEAERVAREAEAAEAEAIANAAQGEFTDVGEAVGEANAAFADYERTAREAARAERDVKGKIAGGIGRAFSLRTKETLLLTDAGKALAAIVAAAGSVPVKVEEALLAAARAHRTTFGALPSGISVSHVRG